MNYFERFTKKKKLIWMSSYIISDLLLIAIFHYMAPRKFNLFFFQMIIADGISLILFILFFQLKNIFLYITSLVYSPMVRFFLQYSFVFFAKLIYLSPKTIIEIYSVYTFIAITPFLYKIITKTNDFTIYSKLATKLFFITMGINAIHRAFLTIIANISLDLIWIFRLIILVLIEIIIIISFVIWIGYTKLDRKNKGISDKI